MSRIKEFIQDVADHSDPEDGDTLLPIADLQFSYPKPLECEFIKLDGSDED